MTVHIYTYTDYPHYTEHKTECTEQEYNKLVEVFRQLRKDKHIQEFMLIRESEVK